VGIGGGVSIVAGAFFAWRLPALRAGARALLAAREVVGGEPAEAATPAAAGAAAAAGKDAD
jgi:hypothetical protein